MENQCIILIAEDESVNFLLLKAMLKSFSCEIIWVKNGRDAVEMCRGSQFLSFVLMDIKMPIMDGITATSEIRKLRPELPVIAQTAYEIQPENKSLFNRYIKKPFNKQELDTVLQSVI